MFYLECHNTVSYVVQTAEEAPTTGYIRDTITTQIYTLYSWRSES